MNLEFKKVSEFDQGKIFELLTAAYSYDCRYNHFCSSEWKECDDFFFANLEIADKCCFITTLDDEAIGLVMWNPRNIPDYAEIGHNCIVPAYKGNGHSKIQLREAINRIIKNGTKKIVVTTNDELIPARRMYESVGFKLYQRRENKTEKDFMGEFIDYEFIPTIINYQ